MISPGGYQLNNNLASAVNASGITLNPAPSTPTETEVYASYETKLKTLRLNLATSRDQALVFTGGIPTLSSAESRYIQRVELAVLTSDTPSESST